MLVNIKEITMSNIFQFTLILDGVDENTSGLEDSLYEAGCDDALINFKNGTVYLDFDREGDDLEKTILTAIKDIESSDLGARIVSVAPEHLVSLTEIADRASITKQAVSLFVQGERRTGDFPHPVLKVANKSPLWRWSAVAKWLYQHGKIKDVKIVEAANVVEDINAALEFRSKNSLEHKQKIFKELTQQFV
jgi:hypothetical protein